jgi:F-type H+-transporting ATPase subunit gamma
MVADVAARPGAETHPLLAQRPVQNAEIIIIGSDRGLAGPFTSNLMREAVRLDRSLDHPTRFITVGRRPRNFVVRSRWQLVSDFPGFGDTASIVDMGHFIHQVLSDYESGSVDVVYLI